MSKKDQKAFHQHRDNGIYLTFPNGNGLSTVWGLYTYSDNYNSDDQFPLKGSKDDIIKFYAKKRPSNTCEVMPDCSDEMKAKLDAEFPDEENGPVFGHLTFDKWLKMVNMLYQDKTNQNHDKGISQEN